MNTMTKSLLAVSIAMAFAASAQAAPQAGTFGTGIAGTKHDFASAAGLIAAEPTAINAVGVGLCTYCHTPHSAQSTLLLWNHTMSANSFSWSDTTTTTAGTALPTLAATYKGPSVKCLSCHDGTVAIGDVSLFYESKTLTGATANNPFKLTGVYQIATAAGSMNGNHPVGIPYPIGGAVSTYNGIVSKANLTEFQGAPETQALSKIKLYTDTGTAMVSGGTTGKAGIECTSCHDPHNKAAVDDLFLRGNLVGTAVADGYICLQCHIK